MAMNATTEELLEVVFSVGFMQRLYKETSWTSHESLQANRQTSLSLL
jgi:hypothetical protein